VLAEWVGWQSHPAWLGSPVIETVYFGGGTPSRLEADSLATILRGVRQDRELAPAAEITLEANPDDVSAQAAEAWRRAGINRVSLGAQSFSAQALEWMHRIHSAEQSEVAFHTLRAAGFRNISLDLIYALPAAIQRDWPADLERALALEPAHLSLYGLTVESGTPLGRWTARGESIPVTDDRAAEEFLHAHQRVEAEGFEHYEVSNAARPGLRARHNSAYWERKPFIGLGPSAHSAFGAIRAWNVREWEEYRRRSEAGRSVRAESENLGETQVALEELYLGLRTKDGLPASKVPEPVRDRWRSQGWAVETGGRVGLTAEGWLRLDALVASLTHC
jgi:oxygen-independent coproporphyrinogen-3 oxidase